MSPFSPNANRCRLLTRPSGECRVCMACHNIAPRRSEFGVAKSWFGQCSPTAWLMIPM